MPDPGATDPTDLRAHARAHLGLSRQLKQTRRETPHPSCGGRGYDTWFRWDQLDKVAIGEDVNVTLSSICRWRERLEPYRATWKKAREQIVGVDLVNLVTFLRACPASHLEEMAVFIYNELGPLYLIDVIYKRLVVLEITKKRASTEAYQAQRGNDDINSALPSITRPIDLSLLSGRGPIVGGGRERERRRGGGREEEGEGMRAGYCCWPSPSAYRWIQGSRREEYH
jgi:hypothetical protein